jgi:hypothetical protein
MRIRRRITWGSVFVGTGRALMSRGYIANAAVAVFFFLIAPLFGGLVMHSKKTIIISAAIGLTFAVWLLAYYMIEQTTETQSPAKPRNRPSAPSIPTSTSPTTSTATSKQPNPAAPQEHMPPPSNPSKQEVTISGSPNTTVYQAGRDIIVNKEPESTSEYRPLSSSLEKKVLDGLKTLKASFPNAVVRVDIEAGSGTRHKLAKALGAYLEEASLGKYPLGNTNIAVAPGYPITITCAATNQAFTDQLIAVISLYIKAKGGMHVESLAERSDSFVRIYLNGEPTFQMDGSVEIE